MELKERLRRGLEQTRRFTDTLLAEIPDEDWLVRPSLGANHTFWIAGHLGLATNHFIGLVDPRKAEPQREDFRTLFGKGTQSIEDAGIYPLPADLRAYLTDRGNAFLSLLNSCSDDDFAREVTGGPPFMYDVGAVFQMGAWHETLHSGQLTIIHRRVGQTPIADRA